MSFWRSWFGQKQSVPRVWVERLGEYGVALEVQERLYRWICDAKAHELSGINPYYLAHQLDLRAEDLLEVLGSAVITGLFCLDWEARCPGCGNQQCAFDSLKTARSEQSCLACGNSYHAHLDHDIIVTFSLNESVRSDGIEDSAWRQKIDQRYGSLSGHELLALQPFRNLFVNEPLPASESFQVRQMTLLFTDLGGSTALYARKGDPFAYGLVRGHFLLLQDIIHQNGGAIVKTIGDAVMAVFSASDQALRAALASQRAMYAFNRELELEKQDQLLLKIGLHTGPCLMVTLNERLDYFGTTVNVAARVQGKAGLEEILFTDEVRRALLDPTLFHELNLSKEQLMLRGLDERPFTVYRTRTPQMQAAQRSLLALA